MAQCIVKYLELLGGQSGLSLDTPRVFNLRTEIEELAEFPENWDGDGALAIPDETTTAAKALVCDIGARATMPLPQVGANPSGTISMYWQSSAGQAELEIGRSRFSWAFHPADGSRPVSKSGDVSPDFGQSFIGEIGALLAPRRQAAVISKVLFSTMSGSVLIPW
jgi:hypothetical protein